MGVVIVTGFPPAVSTLTPVYSIFFHNGVAATLEDVVRFYEASLGFEFTDTERADLVAFLEAL